LEFRAASLASARSARLFGVVEEGALADLIVVNGNPLENIKVIEDPKTNIVVIMKDGMIFKNTLQ
jgi:imidazolonepropionase-like amidohydrolase